MDVKQMTYILTIAQEGGISKAAAKLFITQSALDQQLLKLEHELGTRLFFRSRSSFALTEAGRVYADYARRMLELKNEAYRIIHDIADRRRGTLSLAFAPERGMEMFMAVYPRFYQSYPEVTVTPREISVRRQLEMLAGDELDLGFISRPEGEVPGLTCVPLLREEFLLITPLTVLDTECLWDLTFCLIYRSSTQREVIAPLFERAGRKPNLFLETASNRANVSMVQKRLSCSIVPAYYVQGVEDVACFRLSAHPAWTVSACYRRNRYLSKSAQYFIALAAAYFRPECAAQEKELPQ